jgi:hypothetical protein
MWNGRRTNQEATRIARLEYDKRKAKRIEENRSTDKMPVKPPVEDDLGLTGFRKHRIISY